MGHGTGLHLRKIRVNNRLRSHVVRDIAFEDVKTLDGLFSIISKEKKDRLVYCTITDHRPDAEYIRSLYVMPNERTETFLKKSMLDFCGPYYYQITIHEDGKNALVTAQYERIIGSRWLADIDPKTVPQGK